MLKTLQDIAGILLTKNALRGEQLREIQRELREVCRQGLADTGPELHDACHDAVRTVHVPLHTHLMRLRSVFVMNFVGVLCGFLCMFFC